MTQVGHGYDSTTSAANSGFAKNNIVFPYDSTNLFILEETSGVMAKFPQSSSNASSNFSLNPWYLTFYAKIPIAGWSSNVQMSSDTDTRVVALVSRSSTAQLMSTVVYKKFEIVAKDTHSAYDTSTGLYTVPVSGFYSIQGSIFNSASLAGIYAFVVKNGVNIASGSQFSTNSANSSIFSTVIYCDAGDTLGIRSSANVTTNTSSSGNTLAIHRLSGPSVIAASEIVAASAYLSTNASASTTQPVPFDTLISDTHGALTLGSGFKFTVPVTGYYKISQIANITTTTATSIVIYKNGVAVLAIGYNASGGFFGYGTIFANTGDILDIRPSTNVTVQGGSITDGTKGRIFIERVS
jgi:hypothetical protein